MNRLLFATARFYYNGCPFAGHAGRCSYPADHCRIIRRIGGLPLPVPVIGGK